MLGNISPAKGANILKELDLILPKFKNVHMFLAGKVGFSPKNIKLLGQYKLENLASLMEKNFIDFILIPSIGPETFSYTTEEAMTMGLPVACYDLGAPAERVKKYKKGLDPIQNSLIGMKYIFIPGYNDNLEEIQSWLKIVEDLGMTNLQLELEHHWYEKNKYLPDNIKEYIDLVVKYVHEHKCNLSYREILTTCGYTEVIRYIDNGR